MPIGSFAQGDELWDDYNWDESWSDLMYQVSLLACTCAEPISGPIGVQHIPVDRWMDEPLLGGKGAKKERKIEIEMEEEGGT